ncbi:MULTISPECIES: ABC transporter ATP-binding protein [unclassified Polaromonas]|uniref:ABC transporter ATP-binding protein n=1 Tax=unclassified Polaromonas TaxID=2638319 RepID=UPI0018C918AF|nr:MULTISPECIES: ABC transporter ATP-binding protein [unclassified Polaromonas]MBG6071586.1 ATP-binding cassette subfamily B multidrug efflux pump [Polaromonas sp. CG_9.7]MBG6113587.1 ATP-binding cassette subfamily B multidrug efflux pump [Polaromonas sp. CG_9.2]MDH6184515.1 ATP-binding cassette subfamily B multidrug efflux pump [Polaromonas sp. CG_23.6]
MNLFQKFESLLHAYPEAEPTLPPKGFIAFIWACSQGARGFILGMAVLSGLLAAFEALLFAMMGRIVDWLGRTPPARLWIEQGTTLKVLAGLVVASIAVVALQTVIKHQTLAINFPMRLRWNFHRLMLGQSMAFYQDEFAGRLTTKVMQTALAVRDTLFVLADVLVAMVIYIATMTVLAGAFDLKLVLPFLVWLLLYIGSLFFFVPRLGHVGKQQADARSLMTGRITDAYTNITTVKLFSHTHREAAFARSAMQEFMDTGHSQMRLVSAFEVVNHALSMGLILGMAGTSLWLWQLGEVGVGAVAAATAMALRLQGMSHWIMWEMTSLFESVGTVQDGINTLSRPRVIEDAAQARVLTVPHGEVRFEDVSFSYGQGTRVIEKLNLAVKPGEKIGLIGRSGAGKSTLVNLLLRFHDVEAGRILIDGQNIANVTQDSLRSHIGMVTQDTSLLHRSVRDNITYSRPGATEDAMRLAAQQAEADGFIAGLTDLQGRTGFDAHVGERGVKLSGGQRQRVAIARVMLKDAPILLLDEATSALDSEVEIAIQTSLNTLMKGKTVIAIAHRLSTIAAMDRLIVLDQGRIAEEGSHRELLALGGVYARLWAHQSGGFLPDETDEE